MQEEKHHKSINTVIDYILTNLEQPLTVQMLAERANLSAYHFHRIFTHAVGEPLAKYILRKRLEKAANILRENTNIPVMNIAYQVGFNSSNVFCRNFKKHFGVTAEEMRNKHDQSKSKDSTLNRNYNPKDRLYSHYFCSHKIFKIGDKAMDCTFEIKKLETIHIVYCRHYGAYNKMENAYQTLMQWAYPRGLVTAPNAKLIAVYHDNPELTAPEKLISDACLSVDTPLKTDGDIGSSDLQGGLYAVARFEIAMEEFPLAWQCSFKLMEEHGCQCIGTPFEMYHNNRDKHPERKWIVDICIPVLAK